VGGRRGARSAGAWHAHGRLHPGADGPGRQRLQPQQACLRDLSAAGDLRCTARRPYRSAADTEAGQDPARTRGGGAAAARCARPCAAAEADTGIWAQLWTLPQADSGIALQDWFDAHIEGSLDDAEPLPVLEHTFSHYRLHLQVLVATVQGSRGEDAGVRWVAAEELEKLGLPAPIRNLLQTGAPPAQPKRRTMRRAATSQDNE
jgi:hypothetical protein